MTELTSRLGITNSPHETEPYAALEPDTLGPSDGNVYDSAKDLYGDDMPDIPPGTLDIEGGDCVGTSSTHGTRRNHEGAYSGSSGYVASGGNGGCNGGFNGKRTPGQTGARPFISYVGAHPNDDAPDPDGLDQVARMQIERLAIDLIISLEPKLCRTPEGNPGFDLYEVDSGGRQIRWIEVKSMTGSLAERPVGLSRTQFEYAREKGDAFWLYVVEHATDPTRARVLRIKNPVGLSRTFTFDHGWSKMAFTN